MAGMMDIPLDAWLMIDRATGVARDVPVVTYLANGDVRRGTYGQLADRAQRLMGALDGLRLPRRAVIGTMAPNTERHLEAHLGITGSDRVLHTLNPRSPSADLAQVIAQAGDEAIIVDLDLLPLLRSIPEALGAVRHLIVQAEERPSVEADGLPPLAWYEDLLREQAPVQPAFRS